MDNCYRALFVCALNIEEYEMNLNKLFLRWVTIFGLIIIPLSGWAAVPGFSVGSASTTEGNSISGVTKNIAIPVTLSNIPCDATTHTFSVSYSTPAPSTDTAIKGADYNDASGTLTYNVATKVGSPGSCTVTFSSGIPSVAISNNGSASQSFNVAIRSDIAPELDETFTTQLSGATNGATITTATALSTIVDDDNAVTSFPTGHHRPFTQTVSFNMRGDMKMIGNSVMRDAATHACAATGVKNNSINTEFWDVDVASGTTTYDNSTTANLTLPTGSKATNILWAGLYWQGYLFNNTDSIKEAAKKIQFKTPTASYTEYNSQSNKFNWVYLKENSTGKDRFYYQGVADVTAAVKAGLGGTYGVANLVTDIGQNDGGQYGAWSLVVIYSDTSASFKNLTVYDGYIGVSGVAADLGWNGVYNGTSMTLSGFLTPKSGAVNSFFSIFGGEGDVGSTGDFVSLSNSTSTIKLTNAENPVDDIFNSTISLNGAKVTTMNPSCVSDNYIGIDLDTFDVGSTGQNIIKNNQTSTTVTLGSAGEAYFPGVFAFSTELYVPKFCYDYGYQQNGLPFTEENTGTVMPYITGVLPNTSDINVSIYIRNQENSDVQANNIMLDILDINSSEAIYKRNSVGVTYPTQYTPTYKTDAAWPLSVSDTDIHNIPLGNMGGREYAYAYYALTPQNIGNIHIPINGTFSYNLVVPLPGGTSYTLPYNSTIGGGGLPMCSADNFSYTPEWGIFSVVDAGLYDSSSATKRYYDLTTQVAKRPGNFRVASFDPASLDTPKAVTTIVAVEMIDASQFHDVDAACREPSSAITPRVWMGFENNVSQINFNAATIQNAINNGMVSDVITGQPSPITLATDFFKTATPNAAFRVTFNTLADQNDSLIHIQQTSSGIRIDNFSNIHQVYPHCKQFVINPNNNDTTNITSVACSDNGNHSTYKDVAICMECLYGARTQVLCSRDNFAIRPESYTVTLRDVNQTNHAVTQLFAPGHTGVATPNTERVNVASGYSYRYDINATNHIDNTATPGYTRYFGTGGEDYNITLVWEPVSPKTGCNDTDSKPQSFNMIDGIVSSDGNLSQVGEYRFNIIDKTWTAVDWDSTKQTHQTGTHFLSGAECTPNSSDVPMQANVVGLTGTTLNNLVGCDISSTHDNIENSLKYRDYLLTFHPYKFDMSTIEFGIGTLPSTITSGGNGFAYMSDISRDDSMNMSLRATGSIKASGYNNIVNTNFVSNCYAKDLNLSMISDNNLTHPQKAKYQVRFMDYNSSDTNSTNLIYDSNALDIDTSKLTMKLTTIANGNFVKSTAGSLYTVNRLNYDRNVTVPLTPIKAQLSELDVKCILSSECTMQADLSALHKTVGTRAMDFNVTYAYGRIIPRDVRVFGTTIDAIASAWYEVFNAPILGVTALPPSRNTPQWFTNIVHNDLIYGDGNVTQLQTNGAASAALVPLVGGASVSGVETYNFGHRNIGSYKAHIDTDPWLWYGANASDYADPVTGNTEVACLTHPCFNINVVPDVGRAGSATNTGLRGDKANKATKTGTGVTYDYTPATR